jgi:3-phosphoshikimate 1-carboxyvinyltransferase
VSIPGDKSISHRALMLGAIAEGESTIDGFLAGADCLATMAALESMGVDVTRLDENRYRVAGVGKRGLSAADADLDLGNSGTAMRLLAGLLSAQSFSSRLVGDASLSKRPMNRIIKPLAQMGAEIGSQDGKPPLQISGGARLAGIAYSMPVASAQVKSALMLAALYASGETTIFEPAVCRDHTERMLESMGVELDRGEGRVTVPGGQTLTPVDVDVPADLSSATFPMLAVLLSEAGEATFKNVGVNPSRSGAIEILRAMGAAIDISNVRLLGQEPVADLQVRASSLQAIDVDPGLVPLAIDEFPALFVAAAAAKGTTRFSGISELRVKESDRIAAMARGLKALGVLVTATTNTATVMGGPMTAGRVDSYGDHRIAMAFAVAGSITSGPILVTNTDTVETSFPGFMPCMQKLGVAISEQAADLA